MKQGRPPACSKSWRSSQELVTRALIRGTYLTSELAFGLSSQ
jgi:hypothetical protein